MRGHLSFFGISVQACFEKVVLQTEGFLRPDLLAVLGVAGGLSMTEIFIGIFKIISETPAIVTNPQNLELRLGLGNELESARLGRVEVCA